MFHRILCTFLIGWCAVCSGQHFPKTASVCMLPGVANAFHTADSLRFVVGREAALKWLVAQETASLTVNQRVYRQILLADCYQRLGQWDSTGRILGLLEARIDTMSPALVCDYHYIAGRYRHSRSPRAFDKAYVHYKAAEAYLKDNFCDSLYYAAVLNQLGEVYQYGFHDVVRAQSYFNRSIRIRERYFEEPTADMAISYYNQSVVSRLNGDPVLAEAYARKSLEYSRAIGYQTMELLSYNLLANALSYQNKMEEAVEWMKRLLERAEKEEMDLRWQSFALENLTSMLVETEQYEEAGFYNNLYLSAADPESIDDRYCQALFHNALLSFRAGDTIRAERLYAGAVPVFSKYFGEEGVWTMYIHYWYAEFLQATGRLEAALAHTDTAMSIVAKKWREHGDGMALIEMVLAAALSGDIYRDMGMPDSALHQYDQSAAFLEAYNRQVVIDESRLTASDEYREIYEKLIGLNETLHRSPGRIFELIERNKYRILQDRINEKRRIREKRSDSLSLTLYELGSELEEKEAAYRESGDPGLLIGIGRIREQIRERALLSDTSAWSLKEVLPALQSHLEKGELLLQMFTSDTICYMVLADRSAANGYRFDLTREYLENFGKVLNILNGTDRASGPREYSRLAYAVFRPIREAIEEFCSLDRVRKLIVLPDGLFCNLPFGALPADTTDASSWKSIPYLIGSVDVSYRLSGSRLLQERMGEKVVGTNGQVLALGPAETAGLGTAVMEAETVAALWDHGEFEGHRQIQRLKEAAGRYRILHIASHADIDPDNFYLNRLRFGSDSEDSLMIYNYELGLLDLDADLIVLNACETSLGETFRGEGVYSFSHQLLAAGARCLLTSLWKISDQSSAELITRFYSHLQKGRTIADAINAAQRDFLAEAHPEAAHPYYWAYLVPTGESDRQLKEKKGVKWWTWAAAAGFLLTLCIIALGREASVVRRFFDTA